MRSLTLLALLFANQTAFALACGDVISSNTTLTADLNCVGFGANALTIGADNVELDGAGFAIIVDNNYALRISSQDNANVHDLEIRSVGGSGTGIRVTSSAGLTVNNVIFDGLYRGVFASNPTGIESYTNNTFKNITYRALRLEDGTSNTAVSGNTFTDCIQGIRFLDMVGPFTLSSSNTFTGVATTATGSAVVELDRVADVTIDGLNVVGISAFGNFVEVNDSSNVKVQNNTFTSGRRGVDIRDSFGIKVTNNRFDGMTESAYFLNITPDLVFENNDLSGSLAGIQLVDFAGPWALSPTNNLSNIDASPSKSAVYLQRAEKVDVVGLNLSAPGTHLGTGINLNDVSDVLIDNNNLSGHRRGIRHDTSLGINITVTNNNLSGNSDYAARFSGTDRSLVLEGNTFDGSRYGVEIFDMVGPWSFPGTNSFTGTGTTTSSAAIHLRDTQLITVNNLNLSDVGGIGNAIRLDGTSDSVVTNNNMDGRYRGVYAVLTNNTVLTLDGNSIQNASNASIWLDKQAGNPTITNNNFQGSIRAFRIDEHVGPMQVSNTNDFSSVAETSSSNQVIRVVFSSDIELRDLDLSTASGLGYAVLVENSDDVVVASNNLSGRYRGLDSNGVNTNLVVTNNDVSGADNWGMWLEGLTGTFVFDGNDFSNTRNGLKFEQITGPLSVDLSTEIFDGAAWAGSGSPVVRVEDSTDVEVKNMVVTGTSKSFGIVVHVHDSDSITVSNVQACTYNSGVRVDNSTNSTLVNLSIGATGADGVYVMSTSSTTSIDGAFGGNNIGIDDQGVGTTILRADVLPDGDADGTPDQCDACLADPLGDADGDLICDSVDMCQGDNATGDADTDGYCDDRDCDDLDDQAFPGNPEVCDGIDNNCVGGVDEGLPDFEGDGICDDIDPDDDGDAVNDVDDEEPLNGLLCRDVDVDGCDDCSSGTDDIANDGTDIDADGVCNLTDVDLQPVVLLDSGDVAWTASGVGSPSVVYDPSSGLFVMAFEAQTGTSPDCTVGEWSIGLATSPDGITWTDSGLPAIQPVTNSYYSCVAAHPTLVDRVPGTLVLFFKGEQEKSVCDGGAPAPAWGCDQYTGLGQTVIQWNPGTGTYLVSAPSPAPVLNLGQNFGFPLAVFEGGQYKVGLSLYPEVFMATGPANSLTLGAAPIASPGAAPFATDEVFNAALACTGNPAEVRGWFGGRETDGITVTSEAMGLWQGAGLPFAAGPVQESVVDGEWRHWDVLPAGVGTGDHLFFYSDLNGPGATPQIRWAASDAGMYTPAATGSKVCP